MSYNIIKTTDDFKTWYQSKSPTLNTDMKQISININEKPEWIFWFYYSHGGIMDLEIVNIMNIYPDDKDDLIDKLINDRITCMFTSYYETYTYIYVGKDIPDLSFKPQGFKIQLFLNKKKYIKPIIKGHCYSFDIFSCYIFGLNYTIYKDNIIDLSKNDINKLYRYKHKIIPPFNYYIMNNFNRRKIRI
jgi:hypothetical protein